MGHDLFFHTVLRFGLLCLCLGMLLYWAWQRGRPSLDQTTPTSVKPIKTRSKVLKPFQGLTHKPSCDACEQAAEPRHQALSAPPPLFTCTRGRRRQVDTQQHFCPDHACAYYGWVGLNNIRANGYPGSGPWRQLQCIVCNRYFQETHGTPLHSKHVPPEMWVWAVGALAEGLGIRAVAWVFEVDPNTVLQWLVEAADHLAAFSRLFLHDLRVTQVQLDALFTLLSAVKTGEASEAEAIQRLSRSSHWVWVAIDPVSKLLLSIDVGDRTLVMAQRLVHQVVQVLAVRLKNSAASIQLKSLRLGVYWTEGWCHHLQPEERP